MKMTDIISAKRDGKELDQNQIDFFVSAAAKSTVPEYQLSALLMAIYLNGMSEKETAMLTVAMANSGDICDLSAFGNLSVDKHSTGGVGDKTTLICAPIVAALGCKVAKMSGRGLGHTGGTVDKLESITGYKTDIPYDKLLKNTSKNNLCLIGHSGNMTPADKKLYALRDVTATVESIPLIASSIMSKKIAAGAKSIVLDVKYGSGAFMKTPEEAEQLALAMVKIGKNTGKRTTAVITNMNLPLGRCIGNSIEVEEACEILNGRGDSRLRELCLILAANMYSLCFDVSEDIAYKKCEEVIHNGSAFEKLCDAVKAQGGDIELLTGQKHFAEPSAKLGIKAEKSGYISDIDSFLIGKAAGLSGAGRETLDDKIDYSAGIILHSLYGEYVCKGDIIATVQGEKELLDSAAEIVKSAITISEQKPPEQELLYKIIKGA